MQLKTDLIIPLSTIIFIFIISCAHQQSPSGGPDDTTGPTPTSTTPATESVNVAHNTSIEIVFSEWILPASVKGVALYPPLPLKVKIKGNRLFIKPLTPLADSTTYHCVITSTLKDLHNNPINRPLNIIFSTGPSLDSGSVSGCVSDPAREQLQPNVALFRHPRNEKDSGFCGSPDYLVQTDSNGVFSFSHIRTGTYKLIAYLDKNNDYHLQQGSEELYLPVDPVITISGTTPVTADCYPSVFDTTQQSIASLVTINNVTIAGTWKRPYDSLLHRTAPTFLLEPLDSSGRKIPAVFKQLGASTRFYLLPDTTLDSIAYRLIFSVQPLFDTAVTIDTLRVSGAGQQDTTAPLLISSLPQNQCDLSPTLTLVWSEPVKISDTLWITDTLTSNAVLFIGDTSFNDTSRFVCTHPLQPGHTYKTALLTSSGSDFRGNQLKARDSTDTAAIITLSVLHADSFALSLSGGSPCLDKSAQRRWIFSPLHGGKSITVNDNSNSFLFDSIPAAKGRLSTFIDNNGNNRPDPGRLLPFVAPEPYITFTDTVEARARWDVEGVTLTTCNSCEQKRLLSEKKAAATQKDSLTAEK